MEALAKLIYDHWFVQFDFPDANGKPYKSSGGKMVWNGTLKREIPDGWECVSLGSLLKVCNGKDHKNLADGKNPVYGSGGVIRYVAEKLYDQESVLIPRKGTLNNILYVRVPFWTVDTMFYTSMRYKNLAKYLFLTIRKFDFIQMNTGTGVPSMTSTIINELPILKPTDCNLVSFECLTEPIFDMVEKARREMESLTQLRDWLLPMLMNGQCNVAE